MNKDSPNKLLCCSISPIALWRRRTALIALLLLLGCNLLTSCAPSNEPKSPNVLFIVLDTTRADRLGLYGHNIPTTPFLSEWAKGALVFDNCQSVASTTVPSHASMFTGLLPSTHLVDNLHPSLGDKHDTLAEILSRNGYQSFLFSANPFICKENDFAQGFQVVQHPWSDQHRSRSVEIIRSKIDPADNSSELPQKFRSGHANQWAIKACGEVAQDALISWLDKKDRNRPFFAFINYMEAHRPLLPPRRLREKIMSPAQVSRSYRTDVSWTRMWEYAFGLAEYRKNAQEAISLTYDAAILELDELLRNLLTTLDKRGDLENTIVIITADHGEHLCEHHLLDHQYSLYQPLLKVPMILWYPKRVQPGRNPDPISNIDVFPTILELTGVAPRPESDSPAVSLLNTQAHRVRHSDYLSPARRSIADIQKLHPTWNPKPFVRTLRSVLDGNHKLIWSSDNRHALYNLKDDPGENRNLFDSEPELANAMLTRMRPLAKRSNELGTTNGTRQSAAHLKRMAILGYADAGSSGLDEE